MLRVFFGAFDFFLAGRRDVHGCTEAGLTHVESDMLLQPERRVSRHFLTVTPINTGFGVGVAMMLIGLPQPALGGSRPSRSQSSRDVPGST